LQEKEPVLNAERAVITASRSLVTKQTEKGTILMHRYGKRMTFQKVINRPADSHSNAEYLRAFLLPESLAGIQLEGVSAIQQPKHKKNVQHNSCHLLMSTFC